jgi:hypothetical protein
MMMMKCVTDEKWMSVYILARMEVRNVSANLSGIRITDRAAPSVVKYAKTHSS